ncbi:DUF4111 domain-containing protein [Patescibacteria group bacterium]|jgi:hypothetical protein|nr:DUF4111 domain-containing protein [Patescibacteria group bacterium]
MPPEIQTYLEKLSKHLQTVLESNLVGVYLQGSGAQNDFRSGTSDLDVLVVVHNQIPGTQKDILASELDHKKLPVPAAGLDLMIVRKYAAQHLTQAPEYEFWFSTGEYWDTTVDKNGSTSEVLMYIATCAEQAQVLSGLDPQQVFSAVPHNILLQTLIDILEWHRTKILDNLHDPLGQYSVLNAARAWMYAEDKKLGSKAEGGMWVLVQESDNELVKNALLIRDEKSTTSPDAKEIDIFLQRVIEVCRAKLA